MRKRGNAEAPPLCFRDDKMWVRANEIELTPQGRPAPGPTTASSGTLGVEGLRGHAEAAQRLRNQPVRETNAGFHVEGCSNHHGHPRGSGGNTSLMAEVPRYHYNKAMPREGKLRIHTRRVWVLATTRTPSTTSGTPSRLTRSPSTTRTATRAT